jgi:hypothetical protein
MYVVREFLAVSKLESQYVNLWIVWRGPRVLSWENGWLDYPDISDVMTFRSHRMANRTAFEWKGFTMDLEEAIENGWIVE